MDRIIVEGFDAAIFDMDGVVTDTADLHAAVWKEVFNQFLEGIGGEDFKPFTMTDYRRYVDGRERYDGVRSFLSSRGIELEAGKLDDDPGCGTVCGLGNRKNLLLLERLGWDVEPFGDTIEFIKKLKTMGVWVALISASKNASPVLDSAGVTGLFDVIVDGRDVEDLGLSGKPAPDIFLEAAEELGVEPARCIIVEDAISGIRAGHAGGFGMVIAVVRRDGDIETLLREGADLVVTDFSSVKLMKNHPSALHNVEEIITDAAGKTLCVFLDYDGTLTPIVERPEDARLSEEMRELVTALAAKCVVSIISGRDLSEIQKMVGIEGMYYAGSHGFHLVNPEGEMWEKREANKLLPKLDRAEEKLHKALSSIEGVLVERKRYSIAIHYRRADEKIIPHVKREVEIAKEDGLRLSYAKKVFELQPDIDWNKGRAVIMIMETLGMKKDGFPIYIGDDLTDEDAFSAVKGIGCAILVGERDETLADYRLDQADVGAFLEALGRCC